jgi:hypothetical protein
VFLWLEDESEFEPGDVPVEGLEEEPGVVWLVEPPMEPGVVAEPLWEPPAAPVPMVELPLREGLRSLLEPPWRDCMATVRLSDSTMASRRAMRASIELVLLLEE